MSAEKIADPRSRQSARWAATRLMATVVVASITAMGLAPTASAQDAFEDVTGGSHQASIEALERMGLFEGTECGEREFCPSEPAERWTVAVWLVRVLDGEEPPPVDQSRFADVDNDVWWMPHVERLAELGVTVGCKREPLRFCPEETVTRARMATFLVRAFDLAEAPSAGFADTGGSTHETNIDALFAAGITVGCKQDPLRFCPGTPVSRAQMATLMSRGLDHRPAQPEVVSFSIPEGPRGDDTLISAGRGRTCAVRLDGGVACWGRDGLRERFALGGLQNVVAVSVADHPQFALHTCALHTDGTISCWGEGRQGQLGQGEASTRYLPVKVPGIDDAVAVSAGGQHTCAVHRDGGVSCWGENGNGQLGDGTTNPGYTPKRVSGVSDVATIAAGAFQTCAVHRDGDISCWGRTSAGSAGIAGSRPEKHSAPEAVTSMSVGWDGNCATSVTGAVYCWVWHQTPAEATRRQGLTDVAQMSAGARTNCALHRDGGVSCAGNNHVGQVGDGTTTRRTRMVRLAGISDAVAVSVSMGSLGVETEGSQAITPQACALRADGSALCWGGNEVGQVGDGTTVNRLAPTRVEPVVVIPADQVPLTPTDLLRTWAEAVVQEREADYPWMRVAWDEVRDRTVVVQSGFAGLVRRHCFASADALGCEVETMHITSITLGTFVHELLHVYDLHTGLAPSKAWGAVQLYFATTYPGCYARSENDGAEILADTVNHLMVPGAWLTYHNSKDCPTLPAGSVPTAEAEQVVRQGLANQVPDWYTDNITNGAELWAAWLRGPSLPALANLADEFGGLCSTSWITHPFDPERFPPADSNPFRDGGC